MQVAPAVSKERHPGRTSRVILIAAALGLALAMPATAFAAKGGAGGTSTQAWIALSSASGSGLAAAEPALGDSVRFSSGYATNTRNPWVSLTCYQGDVLVYGEGGAPSSEFSLGGGSSTWLDAGGSASCRAELGDLYWKGGRQYYTYLAHTNFEAAG